MRSFYGLKQNQTQAFTQEGNRLSITKVAVPPLTVVGIRTQERDQRQAVQVGVGEKKRISQALAGNLKKTNVKPRYIRELQVKDTAKYQVGAPVPVSEVLQVGDRVKVQGVTKGKGFAGVMKRWGFKGGPRTHGQSDRARAPGSIGQGTDPGRVWKGKKMAGRMGNQTHTVVGLQVVKVDPGLHELWLTGLLPGARGGLVKITKIGENKAKKLVGEAGTAFLKGQAEPESKPEPQEPQEEKPQEPEKAESKPDKTEKPEA